MKFIFGALILLLSLSAHAGPPIGSRLSYAKTSGTGTCPQTFSVQFNEVRHLSATTFEPATSNVPSEFFDLYNNIGGTPSLGENLVSPTDYGAINVMSYSPDYSKFYRAFGGRNTNTGEAIWVYRCYYRRIR